ncbi:MAG TPA: right-handed parallel beta-helix repeat-containing protein [Planctomycetota bacterium]|nr:right-handed parallel beta-helix repeat-containing protein [Planctomycetota bacterium]
MIRACSTAALLGLARLALGQEPAPPPRAPPAPVVLLTADATLDPAVVYGGLVLAADGITVDGRGARVVGPVQLAAEAAGAPASPATFTGVGLRAAGVNGVTLRHLRLQGFETGLLVEDGRAWHIEDCDLSDNFHDPDFGWGEQGEKGGLVLRRVRDSSLLRTRANRCWNACSLLDCDGLQVQACDFSHASNTCLKLWTVTASTFTGNDLSWGLRIAPGEVHARDSCCVLVESGSDGNRFERNDATHGGDGFFIRVLNGWTSRRNVFSGNDASWANNNGFEAWSPENTYLDNVANHCSYGFWLGASDKTVLRGNEAGWNGDPAGFHNAPESFGHGGIVFVNGPSHHTLVDGNWLHDNAGGGLVLRGDEASDGRAWRAWHWVIQRNRLESNRWGVWMRHARFLDIGPNEFRDNRDGDLFDAGDVDGLRHHDGPAGGAPPQLTLLAFGATPVAGRVVSPDGGLELEARCAGSDAARPPSIAWDFGDGTSAESPLVAHRYAPGFHRVGCTASDGTLSSLAWLDVEVLDAPDGLLPGAGEPARWALAPCAGQAASFDDVEGCAPGEAAVRAHVEPYDGGLAELVWPAARDLTLPLAGRATLAFWIRGRDPNIPAWQGLNPVVTLHADDARWLRLTPTRDLLGDPPDIHFRDEWQRLEVPLAGGDGWTRAVGPGGAPDVARWISFGLDSWGAPPLDVWLCRLSLR